MAAIAAFASVFTLARRAWDRLLRAIFAVTAALVGLSTTVSLLLQRYSFVSGCDSVLLRATAVLSRCSFVRSRAAAARVVNYSPSAAFVHICRAAAHAS